MEQYCSASIPDIIRINSDAIVLERRLEVSQMDLLGGEKTLPGERAKHRRYKRR